VFTQSTDREPYIVVQNFYDKFFTLPIYVYPLNEEFKVYDNIQCVKANSQLTVEDHIPTVPPKSGTTPYTGQNNLTVQEIIDAMDNHPLEYEYHNAWYAFHPKYILDIKRELNKGLKQIVINMVVYPQGNNSLPPVNQSYTIDFDNMIETNNTTKAQTKLRLYV
jgi:hypothetical protein